MIYFLISVRQTLAIVFTDYCRTRRFLYIRCNKSKTSAAAATPAFHINGLSSR